MGGGRIHYDYCLCSCALLVRLSACMEGPWLLCCFRATLDARSPRADAVRSAQSYGSRSCVPTAYCVTLATFGLLTYLGVSTLGLSTTIWERSSELSISLQSSCAGCCTLIKCKYQPSNSDASISGNLIFDYYWGTELYPRVLGKSIRTGGSSMVAFVGYF